MGRVHEDLPQRQPELNKEKGMELKGKRVIALGERDGVQSQTIGKIARAAGAEVALELTYCFV